MSYSTDFREKVLNYIDNGGKLVKACALFSVGSSTINRWQNIRKKQGNLIRQPRPQQPYKIDNNELKLYIDENPDAYLNEIADHFNVTVSGISKALSRMNITRKKSPHSIRSVVK